MPDPKPKIEMIPGRSVVCADATVTLNVLIRITPPQPEVHFPRPPLNLALVLDRSGSMAGASKMPYAREAASFVVQQLLASDRVSVTIFDEQIETIVPNTLAVDKPRIVQQIQRIIPRGSTDLHGGWQAGAVQTESNAITGGINRVLLLSDGRANVGVTDANTLAQAARQLMARGVSTTTLGVGADYNEDLMEAMAKAGDGNYYYIESSKQLVDLFQTELQGLMATVGQKVSLGLEPLEGASISDTLNDFQKAPTGRLMLPNLIVGMPISVVVTLKVPAKAEAVAPLAIRVAWDDPHSGDRRVLLARLDVMHPIELTKWNEWPVDAEVREQEVLLMVARAQKEASHAQERGDYGGTLSRLRDARDYLGTVPSSAAIADELRALREIEGALDRGDELEMRKLSKYRAYGRSRSRLNTPPETPEPPAEKSS